MCRATTAPLSTSSTSKSSPQNSTGTSTSTNTTDNKNNMSSSVRSSSRRSSSKPRSSSSKPLSKPAFQGAKFDKDGCCLKHDSVQLAEQVKQDGKLLWKEVKMNCPKCATDLHKSRRVTSLGGAGKVKRGRTVHGMSNPLREPAKTGRHMDKEFNTPFDDLGRCHHHPHVQLASKKVRGGWKILMSACPKCIEARYEEDHDGGSTCGDGQSVVSSGSSRASSKRSAASKKSVASRTAAVTSSGKFDKNGCCTRHPHMQVAKKKLLGGWKEMRECPKCLDPNYDDLRDDVSLSSRTSKRSMRSTRSAKSNSSRKGGTKTSRYAGLPFDDEGYCHAHPSVRLAKKKTLGGWKVIHDICPDCAHEVGSETGSRSSRRSRSSKKSNGTGRYFDETGSDASSCKSGKSNKSKSKKIRVKDMKFRDENGKDGRYSGDVDADHNPHGQGKMKYKDGTVFVGVWSEGSQVHGKTSKASSSSSSRSAGKSSGSGSSAKPDWTRKDGKSSSGGGVGGVSSGIKTVRKMKWMDYYGDPGEYTGEVDSQNMPNGKGSMKYDHGLIQDGLWTKGQFVEGSEVDVDAAFASLAVSASQQKSGQRSSQQTPPRSRSSRQHREGDKPDIGSREKQTSRASSGRRLDP